jgi:hypothetical protein
MVFEIAVYLSENLTGDPEKINRIILSPVGSPG